MLAEFGEQKKFLDKLPELRLTFERFVKGGPRKGDWPFQAKNTYVWERTEVLNAKGNSFLLNVITDAYYKSLPEADLVITVSSADGRKVQEVLPSLLSLRRRGDIEDFLDLPECLEELKRTVDVFLTPK